MRHLIVAVAVVVHYTMAGPNDISIYEASNHFASQLYQEVASTPGNVLVCPLSVHIALALVHQGAGGTTRSEMAKVLHLSDSNNDIKRNYKQLLSGLQDDVLKIATKMYPALNFKPKDDYVTVAQEYFLSGVEALDFRKAVDAANTINKFVEDKTNNKIHDIIKPESLSDLTRLVIVNAVHFKASWSRPFPPAFTDNFKVTPSKTVQTEFLGLTDYFHYKEDRALGAKILRMDYEDGKYSMVFVLPNKEFGLSEVEAKLANITIASLLSELKEVRVDVTIPKFKIEQEMQLKDILVKMGIREMFDTRADLSNVSLEKGLYVDSVIQKTFIDVNEKGTEAAAATGIVTPLSGGSEENIFKATRPFHFYLIETKTPVILFTGKLVEPKEKTENPPKMSSHNPTEKPEGNSGDHVDSGIDRINTGEDPFNNNRGSGQNNQPVYSHNPNLYQQNYGQSVSPNRFNQNPQTSQSNHRLSNQPSQNFNQRPNFVQKNPAAPEYNQNSYYNQEGYPYSGQYVQQSPQPEFAHHQGTIGAFQHNYN